MKAWPPQVCKAGKGCPKGLEVPAFHWVRMTMVVVGPCDGVDSGDGGHDDDVVVMVVMMVMR